MSRPTKQRKLNNTIALIADGQTEQWYLECAKKHYREGTLKGISIAPKLPQKKQIDDLVSLAKEKVTEGYKKVVLIVDFDEILANSNEFERFKNLTTTTEPWMADVMVVVNNPCLEYWFLLHFTNTKKFFNGFRELEKDLQRYLPDYSKKEGYYHSQSNDIYLKLGGDNGLATARSNSSTPFSIQTCKTVGCSEMGKIFDYFDTL